MIALIQRVKAASVRVDGHVVARIDTGLLVLLGIQKQDTEAHSEQLVRRVLNYRVFTDTAQKMNLSVQEINGSVIWVPQFTLAADTESGNRPGFSSAKHPDLAKPLFLHTVSVAQTLYSHCAAGIFGADMEVALINDGPVTFSLQSRISP